MQSYTVILGQKNSEVLPEERTFLLLFKRIDLLLNGERDKSSQGCFLPYHIPFINSVPIKVAASYMCFSF